MSIERKTAEPKTSTANQQPETTADQLDVYRLKDTYPDAAAVFQLGPKPLENIKDGCLVAVDTNALLLPYTTTAENLAEIKKTYLRLVEEERLFIPAQVSREFAKNRAAKISDLYHNLSQKQGTENKFTPSLYPLLSDFPEYQRAIEIAKEIEEKRKEYQNALKAVVNQVRDWTWNDPVSVAYAEVFSSRNVVEATISEDDFKADCLRRQTLNIPPGFKDDSNGDLMIWHTILEAGRKYEKDLIFVSADEKTDWHLQSSGKALYPRFELVDEYRRASNGGSFHIVRLSKLLELFGAEKEAVEEVRREEGFAQKLAFVLHLDPDVKLNFTMSLAERVEWLVKTFLSNTLREDFQKASIRERFELAQNAVFSGAPDILEVCKADPGIEGHVNRLISDALSILASQ